MSILKKIKLFTWAWSALGKVTKMKKVWEKMSGYKSVFGLLGVAGYYAAKQFNVDVPEFVLDFSYGLLGIGLVHKLDKASGVVTKVLVVLNNVIAALNKKRDEEPK